MSREGGNSKETNNDALWCVFFLHASLDVVDGLMVIGPHLHPTSAAKNNDAPLGGNSSAFVRLTLLDRGEVDWFGGRGRGNGRHISDNHKMLKCCQIRLN